MPSEHTPVGADIDNVVMKALHKKRKRIEAIIEEFGFKPPQLLTPERYMIFEET